MRFIWGPIGIIIGAIILSKTHSLVNFFGRFDWAERYFSGGFGGTYFFYKLLGLLVIVFSALYMFGILDNLIVPFGNIFGGFVPK